MAQRPELRKGGGGQGGVKGEERENGKGCGLTGPLYKKRKNIGCSVNNLWEEGKEAEGGSRGPGFIPKAWWIQSPQSLGLGRGMGCGMCGVHGGRAPSV